MFIKRVLVSNFKADELRILNEVIKLNANPTVIELGNIRQQSKAHITIALIEKVESLPINEFFHCQLMMAGKYYSHVLGYKTDKHNFIAITIGHQAMSANRELIMKGENQSTRMCVTAENKDKLKVLAGQLMLSKFANRLIELQNAWHLDFTREFKVSLGDM